MTSLVLNFVWTWSWTVFTSKFLSWNCGDEFDKPISVWTGMIKELFVCNLQDSRLFCQKTVAVLMRRRLRGSLDIACSKLLVFVNNNADTWLVSVWLMSADADNSGIYVLSAASKLSVWNVNAVSQQHHHVSLSVHCTVTKLSNQLVCLIEFIQTAHSFSFVRLQAAVQCYV